MGAFMGMAVVLFLSYAVPAAIGESVAGKGMGIACGVVGVLAMLYYIGTHDRPRNY